MYINGVYTPNNHGKNTRQRMWPSPLNADRNGIATTSDGKTQYKMLGTGWRRITKKKK